MTPDTASAACDGWDGSECEGTPHCPPRCPRFVDKEGARWTIRPATDADEPSLAEMYERFGRPHRA
ncbi:GNAT family N-acetyltransferase, partial [Halorubrum distributum]